MKNKFLKSFMLFLVLCNVLLLTAGLRSRYDFGGGAFVEWLQLDILFTDGSYEGRFQWNAEDGTSEIGLPGGSVNLQIGQEMLIRVTNDTGSTITNGTPVYISSASGANIRVTPADADYAAGSGIGFRTIGVATENILAGQKGYITTQGFVREINTSFASAAGQPAYLAVGGGYTVTPPTSPDVTYLLGVVTKAGAGTAGEIYVIQTSVPNLNTLSDVLLTNIQDGDHLVWNTASNVWINAAP